MFGTPTVAELEGDQYAATPDGERTTAVRSERAATPLAISRQAPREPRLA